MAADIWAGGAGHVGGHAERGDRRPATGGGPQMKGISVLSLLCALSILLLGGGGSEPSHVVQERAKPPSQEPPAALSPAHQYFSDIILVSQDDEEMRFYSDLLRGKVVVI